jgi:surface antigen
VTFSGYVRSLARPSRVIRASLALASVLTLTVATVSLSQPAEAHGLTCHNRAGHMVRCATRRRSGGAGRIRKASSSQGGGGGIGSWTPVPGHPTYTMHDFSGDPNARYFGVCTWWAWYKHQDEGMLGNAKDWPANARARGYATGTTPQVGATVVFQPGVQGASALGHVGHVEQILDNGWFVISEMNFGWNGGGWGRVDYRYVQAAPGVSFIY